MKIGIVGYGVVGKAQEYLAKRFGNKTIHADIEYDQKIEDCDIIFICVPNGEVKKSVESYKNAKGLLVIKSTVPIGTTDCLIAKHNIHICHNPEFLRTETAYTDVLYPPMIVVGTCCEKHSDILYKFYRDVQASFIETTPSMSETVKLTLNAYLATQLMFWNSIKDLCDKLNIKADNIARIAAYDSRVSPYGFSPIGKPLSGKCLPKDLEHLVNAYNNNSIEPILFNAIKKVSDVHTI